MGRPSNRDARRAEILAAFSRVLADHGYAGATIAAIAREADVAPGLIHHHFDDKEDLLTSLLGELVRRFRVRVRERVDGGDALAAYVDGALKLDERADVTAARCWVGLFSEALRNPVLFKQMRSLIDTEIAAIQTRSGSELDSRDAGAVLAFVVGALVVGAFAPRKTSGFAAPALHRFVEGLRVGARARALVE
ncbi:MAG: TetR/AcrR family transcriptional regulator [Myxococcota bacterium]